jgi:hypothetical protein
MMRIIWEIICAPFVLLWTLIVSLGQFIYEALEKILDGVYLGFGITIGFLLVASMLTKCSHRAKDFNQRLVKVEVIYDEPEEP